MSSAEGHAFAGSKPFQARQSPLPLHYGLTALLIIAATVVRLWLAPELGDRKPFFTFLPCVVLVAWYAGMGPAMFAVVLSTIAATYYFIPPDNSMLIHRPVD